MNKFFVIISFLIISTADAGETHNVNNFGKNPGQLNMLKFVPSKAKKNAPLVVLLHGCSQGDRDYSVGSGWTKYAEKWGFYLLMPSQKSTNNFMRCFNWFEKGDITRAKGESLSIANMVHKMKSDHDIDASKVFVTGLSAGGAMSLVMLATYPDIFKAGGVVAAMPYACSTNMGFAFLCMKMQSTDRSANAWGDLVRSAAPDYKGSYPKLSIWQGAQDPHVAQATAKAVLKQWTNLHGIETQAHKVEQINGHERSVYKKGSKVIIESWLLRGHAHGQPIGPGNSINECGQVREWILDSDICAAYHMAKFWGIDP